MIVCPVCEHPQPQGNECEVCGKRLLAGPSAADLAVPPVPGLEPTGHAPINAGVDRIADLEPTRHAAAAFAGAEPTPGLEATRAAPVDVAVDLTPDIEPTSAPIPGDLPTPHAAVITCRYCRTPAGAGERICGRCGMRLPVVAVTREVAAPAPRLCTCGMAVGGSICPSCGARMPS